MLANLGASYKSGRTVRGSGLLGRVYNNVFLHISIAYQEGSEWSLSDQLVWVGERNKTTGEISVPQ